MRGVVRDVHPVDTCTRLFFSVLTQDYSGDVNIVPSRRIDEILARVEAGHPRLEVVEPERQPA